MGLDQVIGVDIGTSRCRAVLFDTSGRAVEEASRSYEHASPHPGHHEQDPEAVLQAFAATLAAILERADHRTLLGVVLSTYFPSLLPLDRHDRPLAPCMLWADVRGRSALKAILDTVDSTAVYRRTGCPPHPMYPICKPRWFETHRPDLYRRARRWVSIKAYILRRVFGEFLVDWSLASATGMFDIHALQWDPQAVEAAGLLPGQLSIPVSQLTRLPKIRSEFSGLRRAARGVSIYIGGADGTLSNLGVGAVRPGVADNTLGTGGAVRVLVPSPQLDPDMKTWCYSVMPDRWAVGGVTASGLVYEWFIREFGHGVLKHAREREGDIYRHLDELAGTVPAGAGGLLFLPFLAGARAPYWNADARAVLIGLAHDHTYAHVLRAVMEGITLSRFAAFRAVEAVCEGIEAVRVSGGFVRSPHWLQMTADVYGRNLLLPEVPENTAWGAAALLLLAHGAVARLEDLEAAARIRRKVSPDPERVRIYRDLFTRFDRLAQTLAAEHTSPP